jgi:uncharacterized spore protein YtfJ
MKVDELMAGARDALTTKRVFSEPIEKDGITVITAAQASGGGGGGGGPDPQGNEAGGGGFGINVKPAGAFVIRDGRLQWQPAVDLTRVVAVFGAVAIVFLVTRVRLARIRAKANARRPEARRPK